MSSIVFFHNLDSTVKYVKLPVADNTNKEGSFTLLVSLSHNTLYTINTTEHLHQLLSEKYKGD